MNNKYYQRYQILPSMVSENAFKAYSDSDVVVWEYPGNEDGLFCATYNVHPDDYNKLVEGSFEAIAEYLDELWKDSFTTIEDVESSAASLIDGGWTSADIDDIKDEFGLTDEQAEQLEKEMKRLESN